MIAATIIWYGFIIKYCLDWINTSCPGGGGIGVWTDLEAVGVVTLITAVTQQELSLVIISPTELTQLSMETNKPQSTIVPQLHVQNYELQEPEWSKTACNPL